MGLDNNRLTHLSASALCAAITLADCPLLELDLSWNSLRSGAIEQLAEALKANHTLRSLHLGWNSAGSRGGIALGSLLAVNSSLTELRVPQNAIDDEGALSIANALLANNQKLTSLDLSFNDFGPPSVLKLMETITGHPSLRSIALQGAAEARLTTADASRPQTAAAAERPRTAESDDEAEGGPAERLALHGTGYRVQGGPAERLALHARFDVSHPEGGPARLPAARAHACTYAPCMRIGVHVHAHTYTCRCLPARARAPV